MQLDLLVDGGWQHLDLAARGRGSIGKAIYGADQSVRRLLVGGKARNGAFSVAPSRGAPRTKEESESFWKKKVKRLCKKEQQSVGNSA